MEKVKDMKSKKGFTLVEMLAVIIILGVVMIVAAPSVLEALSNSKKTIDDFNKQALLDGAEMYLTDISEGVIQYKNTTGSTITIAKTGHTYANNAVLSPYDFRCYAIEKNGIDIKVTDLVKGEYFDSNCDYNNSSTDCKLKNTCVLKAKIKYETRNGYYVTTGYDISIKEKCYLTSNGSEIK